MLKYYLKQLPHFFARFFYIQLVVSIYSFLITVCWGIPFCPLSFLGNLLFNPVLVLFLGLCTLLFFTELCFIPNEYIAYALDFVSYWWIYALRLGPDNNYNVSCLPPCYLLIATITCATFVIVIQATTYTKKCCSLLLVITLSFCYMTGHKSPAGMIALPCNKGEIHAVPLDNKLVIIDQGYLGRYASAESYVEYTLLPTICQQYGTRTIDHLILLQINATTFKAITKLLELASVKHIYVPVWQGTCTKAMITHFMRMKHIACKKNCLIHRLQEEYYSIAQHVTDYIELERINQQISSSCITYNCYMITGNIDNQKFTFYPAQYTKQL